MTHSYSPGSGAQPSPTSYRKAAAGLLTALLALGALPAAAQTLNYDAGNAQNLAGTYQDLGTTGTAITTANSDDANSDVQNIGFNFPYNGATWSTFILSTNGFIKLGSTPLSDPFLYYAYAQTEAAGTFPGGPVASTDTRSNNILAPFSTDLTAATGGGTEYRVATTGTAPNRICTIQWKNVRDKPKQANSTNTAVIGTQLDNFSFQVKLYETTGQIDFVYGPSTAGAGPDAFRTVAIGIKGTDPAAGKVVMADKGSTAAWSAANFIANNYQLINYYFSADPHNVRSSVRPDAGRTYRFRANIDTDLAVQAVYTIGQLPIGTPHTVRASIRNAGTQTLVNQPVRLDVTGINTFTNTQTIGRLDPGASTTVTFAAYTSGSRLGANSVTVSVPTDAYANSDVRTETQTLTANTFNYAPLQLTQTPTYYGFGTREGISAVLYTAPRATTILSVTDFIPTGSNSTGQPIQGVIMNSAGTVLDVTPVYTVRAADLGTTVTLTLSTPVAIPAGDFLVGISQQAGTTEHYPVGLLGEGPTRTGSFFSRGNRLTGSFIDAAADGYGPLMIGATMSNTVTGTAKGAAAIDFALVPNPTRASAQLTVAEATATARQIVVLDALGRQVRSQELPARATQAALNVADLPRGLYTVRVGATAQRLVVE
ncbi:T9SS type A sorting domain-containing protein [Hymenobacter lucidus]|uniref:T9SS type A sorting domain-containing protein n=1 Tax=Hymenobacter lucidus TaxID=2880930 RepID=A0ABS8APC0_9BACT|nr:T9SS type A sorting domain-containing protein [Hymenobacter lucidus]MCB2408057.1 T9SS type A sorting domain-containing protein [Hymenobacter lucidus]